MGKTLGCIIPEKLKKRMILVSSGLGLNKQIWFKVKRDCANELHEIIINGDVRHWPNVSIRTALMREKKTGGSPLIRPRNPKEYSDRKFLAEELRRLKEECEKYNGRKDWHQNDYLCLFSSPLNINHLFVGVSVHFDISQFMKGGWGKVRRGFSLMPIVIEAQQGTWPRYFNTGKSEETRNSFVNLKLDDPHAQWKDCIASINGNNLVAETVRETLGYVCSKESQIKIISIAKAMNFRWIGFDAQYIAENDSGHQAGFAIYDFDGFQ